MSREFRWRHQLAGEQSGGALLQLGEGSSLSCDDGGDGSPAPVSDEVAMSTVGYADALPVAPHLAEVSEIGRMPYALRRKVEGVS